jgi:hypothetical protein
MYSKARLGGRPRILVWFGVLAWSVSAVSQAHAQKGGRAAHVSAPHMSAPHSSPSHASFRAPRPPQMPKMNNSAFRQTNGVNVNRSSMARAPKSISTSTTARRSPSTAGTSGARVGITGTTAIGTNVNSGSTVRTPGRSRRYWGYSSGNRRGAYRTSSSQAQRFNQMVIGQLRTAQAHLVRVNHDYRGHRSRAVHHVGMAIRQLSHRSTMYQGVGYSPRLAGRGAGRGMGNGGARVMSQTQSDARMRHAYYRLQGAGQMLAQGTNNTTGINSSRSRAFGYVQMAMREVNMGLTVR